MIFAKILLNKKSEEDYIMSIIQSLRNLPIITVTASIDIVPLSQYETNSTDLAKVEVNLRLQEPLKEEMKILVPSGNFKTPKVYLPNGEKANIGDNDPALIEDIDALKLKINDSINQFIDQPNPENMNNTAILMAEYYEYKSWLNVVSVPAGNSYITLEFTKPIIFNAETGEHILETVIPLQSFSMTNQQGSKASLIVLMPIEINDPNKIIEGIWTPPNGVATPLEKTLIAGRQALTGYWQYDPIIRIRYKY